MDNVNVDSTERRSKTVLCGGNMSDTSTTHRSLENDAVEGNEYYIPG